MYERFDKEILPPTGIEAAKIVAGYLNLRCNTCDEGDAANIIHILHQHGVNFAALTSEVKND